MTMAAVIDRRTAQASAQPRPAAIARVDIISDFAAVEPIWRSLELSGLSTPYQRFDFLHAWQHHAAGPGEAAAIVVAVDAEQRPLVLLPLIVSRVAGVRIATFMGGKHTTFNMGLWDRAFAAAVTPADLEPLFAALRARHLADVLALTQQPMRWRGQDNPLACLPRQPSVNDCPVLTMPVDVEPSVLMSSSFRRRLKSKEKKLQALAGYRYVLANSDAEIKRLLDWFFKVKPVRMAEQKLPNVFAEPGIEAFVRGACLARSPSGRHAIEIHALNCDEEIIALFAGVADGERFSMMFNTYTLSENARWSPGLILMRHIIDHYAAQAYRGLDLGIGADDYKRMFCKDDELIFDSFIPLSGRGRLVATTLSALHRGKRIVKHSPILFDLAQRLRGTFHQAATPR